MIDIVNGINHYQGAFYDVDNNALLQSRREGIIHANEQNKIAQQAATELAGAINALDIHEDYRYKKVQLLNALDNTINTTLQDYAGNLRYGVNQLMQMSRDIMTSPEITGLVETNRQYKEWKAGIKARTDISDDIKEMYIDKNPYVFKEQYKTDEEGNEEIVGYDDWKPNSNPVQQLNLNELNLIALRYINPDMSRNAIITYYDENGYILTGDDIINAKAYQINNQTIQEISRDKILAALSAAYASNPAVKASMEQDYELARWKYEKTGVDLYGYVDNNGLFKSAEKYKNNIFENIVKAFKYKNVINDYGGVAGFGGSGSESNTNGNNTNNIIIREEPVVQVGSIRTDVRDINQVNQEIINALDAM